MKRCPEVCSSGPTLMIVVVLLLAGCAPAAPPAAAPTAAPADEPVVTYAPRNRPDVSGTRGAVVSGHPLASAEGFRVLASGGNAVDAAVTMAGVLAVVRPHMNGVGGDAHALFYRAESREVHGLNGSGRAGALATPAFFREQGAERVPGSGPLTVTVPGAVSAWAAALERYGTITLAQALEPAIRYAEEGFTVSTTLHDDIGSGARLNPAGKAIFAPNGSAPAVGTLLRNPALARTLRQIAAEGPGAMYGGSIGASIASFLEMEGGYLRLPDFAAHEPTWVDPISVDYEGKRIYGNPPNTQGMALLQQLGIARSLPLKSMGHNSADYLHTLVEAKKIVFADRDRWVADPEFSPAPIDRLLAADYLRERAGMIGAVASAEYSPGLEQSAVAPSGDGEGDTVYLMAVDQWGNAVSWIQSLFGSFGSNLVEPNTGIVLQNRGAGFTLDADHPNVVAPRKRPFHTLTPHLVTHPDGRLAMTFGTPGGDSQPQSLQQIFNNIFLFGMTPQEAVEAPRYRSFAGRRLAVESRVPMDVREELRRRGHDLSVVDGWTATFGGTQVILVDPVSGALRTGADPRREAYGIAY